MICERCRGLKLLDHFYGMANDGSVWRYDGLRCVHCGSVTGVQMGEGAVNDASHDAERATGIHCAFRPRLCNNSLLRSFHRYSRSGRNRPLE